MIDLAVSEEEKNAASIDYVVADCCQDLPFEAKFDLVTASFLLNYSTSKGTEQAYFLKHVIVTRVFTKKCRSFKRYHW